MYEPKVAYRNKLVLVWLSACLGITFFPLQSIIFSSPLRLPPPPKKMGALLPPDAENHSYATELNPDHTVRGLND